MNTQALPSARRSWLEQAAEILREWAAWRRRKVKLEHVVEVSAFATMLAAWAVAFCVLCPSEPLRHHQAHVVEARP